MGKDPKKRNTRKTAHRRLWIEGTFFLIIIIAVLFFAASISSREKPGDLLQAYMDKIAKKDYEKMYQMIDISASKGISKEDFIKRNSNIYEGIEVQNLQIKVTGDRNSGKKITYESSFDTAAGEICFENEASFVKVKGKYKLVWDDNLIFPGLTSKDKIRIITNEAERGQILDRNGKVLAGKGVASSVGIVPMNLQDKESAIDQLSVLLEVDKEAIEKKLSANWVKEDSFVPVKTIPKVKEIDLMTLVPDEAVLKEQKRQEEIAAIPGIMITDVEVREYPLKEAASHLIGYVQNVTAEDLEEHAGEGYHSNSVIGRSGMESLYEKELKGNSGCEIYIEDINKNKKELLAYTAVQNGQDVKLTIDAELQMSLYEQFKEDKSCSVAMNPYTGEVLALVSTPSFNSNDFIMGMSDQLWTSLNEDERKPLYNRFRQTWSPGSTLKPVVAAIGLNSGTLNPDEDFGNEGLSWQKDASWGDYYVTTTHAYEPVVLDNAMIYSDNIYFAKAALKMGADSFTQALKNLGFDQEIPFEIKMAESQFSNTESIESEVHLADSGYGQGQILVNPLHLAALYTAFSNEGNVLQPRLLYEEQKAPAIWLPNAFPPEVTERVLGTMVKVINDPNGTGHSAHRADYVLAGKTGTAEIKASKDDTTGTELGWLAIFTTESEIEKPVLLISMAEDVKEIGGARYVINKDNSVLEAYLQ